MTSALFASLTARRPLAWLRQAFGPASERAVRVVSDQVRELRKGETLVLDHAGGQGVVCLEGALRITHDPVARDDFAALGGRQQARCNMRMFVHALADSRLCMPAPLAV